MNGIRLGLIVALLALKASGAQLPSDPAAVRPLAVGSQSPTATLDALEGDKADLAEVFAAKPTILIFYRGGWCPFCNRQLASLADSELEFRRLGYQIVAVSPDPVRDLDKTAAGQHLHYLLLSDRQMKIAAAYQVAFQIPAKDEPNYRANGIELPKIPGGTDYWLTIPTAFVIGRDGKIKFVYSNSDPSVTASTESLMAAAKAAAAVGLRD